MAVAGSPSGARWRDVYLAAGARGISVCGDFLAATALALALQTAGAGGLAVSGLLLASTLPLVLLAPLTGRIADRVDSRTLLVVVGLAQAAGCTALAFTGEPAMMMALVALLSVGLAITQPTLSALLPDMVGRAELPRASAIGQTAVSLGGLLAPVLAGLLVGQFGVRPPLLLDAASYLAIPAAGLLLRTRRGGRARLSEEPAIPGGPAGSGAVGPAGECGTGGPGQNWRLTADPLLRAVIISVSCVIGAVGAINVVAVFFIRETLHASPTTYGVVESAWMIGVLGGAWLLGTLAGRARDDGTLVLGLLAQLGVLAAMIGAGAAVGSPAWLVPLWLVGGACNGGTNVFDNLLLANRVPHTERGRAFAVLGAAVSGASMGGFLAGGVLLGYLPPRPLVAALGLAGASVVAVLVVPVLRAVRQERAARPAGGRYLAGGRVTHAPQSRRAAGGGPRAGLR